MKLAPDTNVLVRFFVGDDEGQARIAKRELEEADRLVLPTVMLCEVVWVLARAYRLPRMDIAEKIRALTEVDKAEFNRPAVEAGLRMLEAGGDFADGVIAYKAEVMGADSLLTFDRKAAKRLAAFGGRVRLVG